MHFLFWTEKGHGCSFPTKLSTHGASNRLECSSQRREALTPHMTSYYEQFRVMNFKWQDISLLFLLSFSMYHHFYLVLSTIERPRVHLNNTSFTRFCLRWLVPLYLMVSPVDMHLVDKYEMKKCVSACIIYILFPLQGIKYYPSTPNFLSLYQLWYLDWAFRDHFVFRHLMLSTLYGFLYALWTFLGKLRVSMKRIEWYFHHHHYSDCM